MKHSLSDPRPRSYGCHLMFFVAAVVAVVLAMPSRAAAVCPNGADVDLDGVDDGCDPCISGIPFNTTPNNLVKFRRINSHPLPDRMPIFRGHITFPFANFNPADGAQLVVRKASQPGNQAGYVVLTFPPGTYGGPGTAGWQRVPANPLFPATGWIYHDETAPPVRIKVIVRKAGGSVVMVKIRFDDTGSGLSPVAPADLPLTASFVFGGAAAGAAGNCGDTGFLSPDCTLFNGQRSLNCID